MKIDIKRYNVNFYNKRYELTANSAKVILAEVVKILPKIDSVVDFGCG